MKAYVLVALAAVFLLAGPVGCGKKEIEDLKTRVAGLEKELADGKTKLADMDRQLEEEHARLKECAAKSVKVQVERDRLKQELNALKKKRR